MKISSQIIFYNFFFSAFVFGKSASLSLTKRQINQNFLLKTFDKNLKFSLFNSSLKTKAELKFTKFLTLYAKISKINFKKSQFILEIPFKLHFKFNKKINFNLNLRSVKSETASLNIYDLVMIAAPINASAHISDTDISTLLVPTLANNTSIATPTPPMKNNLEQKISDAIISFMANLNKQNEQINKKNFLLALQETLAEYPNFLKNHNKSKKNIWTKDKITNHKLTNKEDEISLREAFLFDIHSRFKDKILKASIENKNKAFLLEAIQNSSLFQETFLNLKTIEYFIQNPIKSGGKLQTQKDRDNLFAKKTLSFIERLFNRKGEFQSNKLRFHDHPRGEIKERNHWVNSLDVFLSDLVTSDTIRISSDDADKLELKDLAIYLEEFKNAFGFEFDIFPSDLMNNEEVNAQPSSRNLQLLAILTAPIKPLEKIKSKKLREKIEGKELTQQQRSILLIPPHYDIGVFFKSLGKMFTSPISSLGTITLEIVRFLRNKPYNDAFFKQVERARNILSPIDLATDGVIGSCSQGIGFPAVFIKRLIGTFFHHFGKILHKEKINLESFLKNLGSIKEIQNIFSKKNWGKGAKGVQASLEKFLKENENIFSDYLKNNKENINANSSEKILQLLTTGSQNYLSAALKNRHFLEMVKFFISEADQALMENEAHLPNIKYTKMYQLPDVQIHGDDLLIPITVTKKDGSTEEIFSKINIEDYSIVLETGEKQFVYWDKLNKNWQMLQERTERDLGLHYAKKFAVTPAERIKVKELNNLGSIKIQNVVNFLDKNMSLETSNKSLEELLFINFFGQIVPIIPKDNKYFLKSIYATGDDEDENLREVYRGADGHWRLLKHLYPLSALYDAKRFKNLPSSQDCDPVENLKNFIGTANKERFLSHYKGKLKGKISLSKNLKQNSSNEHLFYDEKQQKYLKLGTMYYKVIQWKVDNNHQDSFRYSFSDDDMSLLFSVDTAERKKKPKLNFFMQPRFELTPLLSDELKRNRINPKEIFPENLSINPDLGIFKEKDSNLFYICCGKNQYYEIYNYPSDNGIDRFSFSPMSLNSGWGDFSGVSPELPFFIATNDLGLKSALHTHILNNFEYEGQILEKSENEKGIEWRYLLNFVPENYVYKLVIKAKIEKADMIFNIKPYVTVGFNKTNNNDEIEKIQILPNEHCLVTLKSVPGNVVNNGTIIGTSSRSVRIAYANTEAFNRLYSVNNRPNPFKILFVVEDENDYSKNRVSYEKPIFQGKNLKELLEQTDSPEREELTDFLNLKISNDEEKGLEEPIIDELQEHNISLYDIAPEDLTFENGRIIITNFDKAIIYSKDHHFSAFDKATYYVLKHKLREILELFIQDKP